MASDKIIVEVLDYWFYEDNIFMIMKIGEKISLIQRELKRIEE